MESHWTMSIVVPTIFFLITIAVAALTLAAIQARSRVVRGWVRLENAVVVESKVESRGRWSFPVIVYEYHSNDVYYMGQDSPWPLFPLSQTQAEQWAVRYEPGDVVTIFVNPDDHEASVLFPSPPVWLCIAGLFCVIAFACTGGVILLQ